MVQRLEAAANPYAPESDTRHAGKIFVLTQVVLRAANATSSDGSDASVLSDRFLLCLWDLDDGTSLWIELQSNGDFDIPYASKRLYSGQDSNWMDASKTSRYRDGTIWRFGRAGVPFRHSQAQQRALTLDELNVVRSRISRASVDALVKLTD